MAQQVTDAEVQELARVWYGMLDRHDPADGYLPLLATDVEFQFPEGTVRGLDGFRDWYEGVIRIFFDEVHTLKEVTPTLKDGQVEVKVVVNWQASRWKPPAAASERIVADAYQTWIVTRSPETDKAVISRYVVDGLKYEPGSVEL